MKLAKINDHNELVKDVSSGAVLLNDRTSANDYLARKKMLSTSRTMTDEINTMKNKIAEIDTIKDDLAEIKELLKGLAHR